MLSIYIKKIIYIISFCLAFQIAFASNQHNISGKVTDEYGRPIPGATIRVLNTMLGTVVKTNGEFSLQNLPHGNFTLSIGAVGYKRAKKDINTDEKNSDLEIKLEESAVQTAGVVVTATRSEKIYEDVAVKVSVLDDKMFASTNSISLKEGLSFQPGLRVETTCQNCGVSQVRLNGLDGKYSQILIDSKPIFSPLNGVYGLDQIPANMIDRVEVIRGGASSLYGGSAIGGVINIITKDPSANTFKAGVTNSIFDGKKTETSIQLSSSIINEKQNFGLFVFGGTTSRDPWDANGDDFTEISRYDVKTIGTRIFYKPNHLSRLSLEYHTVADDRRGGNKLELPEHDADITEATRHKTHSGSFSYEQYINSNSDKLSVYASFQTTNRNSYYGARQDLKAYGTTRNETYAAGIQISKIFQNLLSADHVFTAGYEFNSDWINDLALGYGRTINQKTNVNGIYIQDDIDFGTILDFVVGARFDKHNMINNVIISPRANAIYKITKDISLRANISTGYRAPQAFDEDLHVTVVGGAVHIIRLDKNLKEENSLSTGGSIDFSFDLFKLPASLSIEYFNTKLDDAFVLRESGEDANGNTILERTNGSGAVVAGVTSEFQISEGNLFNLTAGFTLQSSKHQKLEFWSIEAAGTKNMLRTPDWYGYINISLSPFDFMDINYSGVLTGPMYVPHFAGYVPNDILLKSDTFFDMNLDFSFYVFNDPKIKLNMGVHNLLNNYQNDFDKGIERDAGFIYGPGKPITYVFGMQMEM